MLCELLIAGTVFYLSFFLLFLFHIAADDVILSDEKTLKELTEEQLVLSVARAPLRRGTLRLLELIPALVLSLGLTEQLHSALAQAREQRARALALTLQGIPTTEALEQRQVQRVVQARWQRGSAQVRANG